MKKLLIPMLIALALLCGCGAGSEPAPAAAPTPALAPAAKEARVITDVPATGGESAPVEQSAPAAAEAPEEPAAQEPEITSEEMRKALELVGETAEKLYAAIGYPESSDYATSCLGPGDDGNLYYDGFTVYTYRENGTETIRHVE